MKLCSDFLIGACLLTAITSPALADPPIELRGENAFLSDHRAGLRVAILVGSENAFDVRFQCKVGDRW